MLPRDLGVAEVVNRILREHTPILTEADEKEILHRAKTDPDAADLAVRTCSCGAQLEGYFEYGYHIREVSGLWRLDS